MYSVEYDDKKKIDFDYYYFYHSSLSSYPSFEYTDRVENKRTRCDRTTLEFRNGVLYCN